MEREFEGIYIAYMTGPLGSSLGMYVFKDGKIAGGDVGGGRYKGTFSINADLNKANCNLEFLGLPGTPTIGGAVFPSGTQPVFVPISIPLPVDPNTILKFQTPLGPINVKLEKIQSL